MVKDTKIKEENKKTAKPVKKPVVKKEAKAKPKVSKKDIVSPKKEKVTKKDVVAKTEKKNVADEKTAPVKKKRYYETVGRRKTSTARVRLWTAHPSESAESGGFVVNDKKHTEYFLTQESLLICEESLRKMKSFNRFRISVRVKGGGVMSQAGAVRHGIARALVEFDSNFRKKLKKAKFLIRDPRMRERKKYGLKRARKAPQWVKR